MTNKTTFKILISSPSDVVKEKRIVKEVIDQLNDVIFQNNEKIQLELLGLGISSYSSIEGVDSQDILNKQFGDEYDIFIGIMWKKFGTPTKRAESGTVEEFNRAYNRCKKDPSKMKVGFYFNTNNKNLTEVNLEELNKIEGFKNKFITNEYTIIFQQYNSYKNFEKLIRCNLAIFIHELLESRNLLLEINLVNKFMRDQLDLFIMYNKEIDNITIPMDFNFNSFTNLNLEKLTPDLIIAILENMLKELETSASVLENALNNFDDCIKKMFNSVSNIIIFISTIKMTDLKIKIFEIIEDALGNNIIKFNTYLQEFENIKLNFEKLNQPLISEIKFKYINTLDKSIENFKCYNNIMTINLNFLEKLNTNMKM